MADLSKVKKGDALAYVQQIAWGSLVSRATKVFVAKKNLKSVTFDHEGREHRVDLEGHGSRADEVVVWDDEAEAQRVWEAEVYRADRELVVFQQPDGALLKGLQPADVVRERVLFDELRLLRASYEAKAKELVARMVMTRTS